MLSEYCNSKAVTTECTADIKKYAKNSDANVKCLRNVLRILKNQIGNPDIVIVFTGTVAHKMVRVASGQAEKSGAIIKHCNSSSACALNDALTECFCKAV